MNQHKPNCSINIRCAVYHADGICNHPIYGKCDCGADSPSQPNSEEKCTCKEVNPFPKNSWGRVSCDKCHSPNPEEKWCPCSKNIEKGKCTHTSNEWVTNEILKILAYQQQITNQGINYTGEKDWALNKIKSLLSQSEQRVRKEMVEKIKQTQEQYYSLDKKTKERVYSGGGQCRECSKRKDTLEVDDIINLISK